MSKVQLHENILFVCYKEVLWLLGLLRYEAPKNIVISNKILKEIRINLQEYTIPY